MNSPRFKKGQVVVVIRAYSLPEYQGYVGAIEEVEWFPYGVSDGVTCYYRLEGYPHDVVTAEHRLCPYDPPASWDDEDMVWKPEKYGRTEEKENQKPVETV